MTLGLKKTKAALQRLASTEVPRYSGSPFEGDEVKDTCEIVLHEICHARLLSLPYDSDSERIDDEVREKPKYLADRNEMQTIALELLLAKRLRLRFEETRLLEAGLRNTHLYHLQTLVRFKRAVERAQRNPRVKRLAREIKKDLELASRTSLQ